MIAPSFVRAVVVHGLGHARLALRAGRPVCLLSGQGAGRYAGVGWWRAMIEAATEDAPPGLPSCDVLDCGDAPGAAMAALRHGQRRLILDPRCPAFAAVATAAGTLGARVLDRRPVALDLGCKDAERSLAAWLAGPDLTRPADDSGGGLR